MSYKYPGYGEQLESFLSKLEESGVKSSSLRSYRSILSKVGELIDKPVGEFAPEEAGALASGMGYGRTSIPVVRSLLTRFVSYVRDERLPERASSGGWRKKRGSKYMEMGGLLGEFRESLEADGKSACTVRNYLWAVSKAEKIAGKPIDQFDFSDLDRVRAQNRKKSADTMLFDSALRMVLTWIARNRREPRYREMADFKTKQPSRPQQLGLTLEEYQRVLEAAADPLDRALIRVLYSTGIRIGELVGNSVKANPGVMVEDINFDMGCFPVEGKRGRIEMAYFVLDRDETMRVVKDYLGERGSGKLFPISDAEARRRLGSIRKRTGIPIHCHALRHTACTQMIRSGMRERYVSEAMRHKDSRITRRYTHLVSPDILGEINRVEKLEKNQVGVEDPSSA